MEDKMKPTRARVVRWYPIPEDIRTGGSGCPYKTVGLVELTVNERAQVQEQTEETPGQATAVGTELAFVGVDKERVVGAEKVRIWHEFPPKLVSLCQLAYMRLHFPDEVQTKSFFDGAETELS